METQDNPIPAELAAEPTAAVPQHAEPELSRDELVELVDELARGMDRLASEIQQKRRQPLEVATQLQTWARAAREQAGPR